jgi:TfoX/Sxy family transcriptional regulator of competence genes
MFGNLSAFVNGNLFSGVFGEDIFVRLFEDQQKELYKNKDATAFAPMAGRPMKEYVVLPREWTKHPDKAKLWVNRSMEWTGKMPEKKKNGKK